MSLDNLADETTESIDPTVYREILAYRRDYADEYDMQLVDTGDIELKPGETPVQYVVLAYKDKYTKLEVMNRIYTKDDTPYNQPAQHAGYIVVNNDVYYIWEFNDLSTETDYAE